MTKAEFARRMGIQRQNVNALFKTNNLEIIALVAKALFFCKNKGVEVEKFRIFADQRISLTEFFKNLTGMKKILILALAVCAVVSCAKPTKCKCKFELNSEILDLKIEDQLIERPEDKKCSQIKVEDIKGDVISVDLSKIGSIDCVNYQE